MNVITGSLIAVFWAVMALIGALGGLVFVLALGKALP